MNARWYIAAASIGTLAWLSHTPQAQPAFNAAGATAIDGDTFIWHSERFRLTAVDAPELPGHCRQGRACAQGDPYRSMTALQILLDAGPSCRREGLDYYRRILVTCTTPQGSDVGGLLVRGGFAQPYKWS